MGCCLQGSMGTHKLLYPKLSADLHTSTTLEFGEVDLVRGWSLHSYGQVLTVLKETTHCQRKVNTNPAYRPLVCNGDLPALVL